MVGLEARALWLGVVDGRFSAEMWASCDSPMNTHSCDTKTFAVGSKRIGRPGWPALAWRILDRSWVSWRVPSSRRTHERPERNIRPDSHRSGIGTLHSWLVAAASTGLSLHRSG